MNLFQTRDPITASWLFALAILFIVVVALPLLRLAAAGLLYGYAALTGRHQLRATAARLMPKLGHLLGSVVVGIAAVASPAAAAGETEASGISVDRDGGVRVSHSETPQPTTTSAAESATVHTPVVGKVAPPDMQRTTTLYVVKTGDTLWDIAADRLDAPTNTEITETWKAIWRANRMTIGDHPELIRPGMELVLEGVES